MTRYLVRRSVNAVVVFICLSLFVFLLLRLAPGNPVTQLLGEQATPQKVKQLTDQLGLNKPILTQYIHFMAGPLHGNFGTSIVTDEPAGSYMLARLPASLELAGAAALMTVIVAIPAGMIMASKPRGVRDRAGMAAAIFGVSAPPFWLGVILLELFAVRLGWFPAAGRGPSVASSVSAAVHGSWAPALSTLKYIFLPALTLAALEIGLISRLMRSSLVDELSRGYVRAARARGLPFWMVVNKHVLRNAILPIVTVFGLELSALMGGVVIVETVFAWPGLGQAIFSAIESRDYPLAQAGVLMAGAIVIVVDLVVDWLYPLLDPRIRYQSGNRS